MEHPDLQPSRITIDGSEAVAMKTRSRCVCKAPTIDLGGQQL